MRWFEPELCGPVSSRDSIADSSGSIGVTVRSRDPSRRVRAVLSEHAPVLSMMTEVGDEAGIGPRLRRLHYFHVRIVV
jgi:hypothetical protein